MNFLLRAMARSSLLLLLCMVMMQTLIKTEDAISMNKNNSTARIARISLESKVLDPGDKFHDEALFSFNQPSHEPVRSTTNNNTSTTGKKRVKNADRTSRRLSNIWSMFLPSSNNEDYEDTTSNSNGLELSTVDDNNGGNKDPKNVTAEVGELNRKEANFVASENHEDKLVAKYRRPLKPSSQHPVEPLTADPIRVQFSNETSTVHTPPLMASTVGSINSQATDMNDIMSNIMNSMSSASQIYAHRVHLPKLGPPTATSSSIEREDELPDGVSSNKTKEGDQFERWLNKIKFRESDREVVHSNLTGSTNRIAYGPNTVKLDHTKRGESSSGRVNFSTDRKQDNNFSSTKTSSNSIKSSPVKSPVHQMARLRQSPGQQLANIKGAQKPSALGLNQPYAQASTAIININADDNSTAPATNNKLDNISANLTEMTVDQNLLQSQDEILKQVTNAINFEQQQLNNRRENNQKRDPTQEESTPSPSVQDDDSQLEGFKLFKVGTSMNELIDGTDRTSRPVQHNKTNNTASKVSSHEMNESTHPNKNASNETELLETIKTLTEKLHSMSSPQTSGLEKQLSSDQPMWLQHKLLLNNNHLLKSNLSKPANFVEEGGASKLEKSQLDQLRELVDKHERTKNELKSTQESMYQFLKQFMGSDASAKLLASPDANTLLNNLTGSAGGQKTAALSHPGWIPMTLAHQAPVHTDRLYGTPKGSYPIRINQLKDNIGQGEDLLDKDNYLNDLSNLYQEHQSELKHHQYEPIDSLHAMTLGGKGEMDDHEIGQLELAAHQLIGSNGKNSPVKRTRFKLDPKPHLGQQKLVSLAESMLHDSKHGGLRFPSKHFILDRKRQNGTPANNLANHMMQTIQKDTDNQQSEKPNQQVEEQLSSQDPMSLQTSKVSSEASETLRQKDSAAMLTRTRLGPHMMAQLSLPAGPPTKIQLSLDTTPNHTPVVAHAKLRLPSSFAGSGVTGSLVTPDMAHDVGLRAPIVAANLPANNLPVRFREVSIYRPFGYESHHAIAYQASPAIAALFPGFAQSTRPSMLRHMTPFRAIQTQRGLINPIMPAFQVIDNTVRSNPAPQSVDQFQQTASMSSQSLPIDGASRIRPGFGAQFGAGSLLKRQSYRTKALSNKWPPLSTNQLAVDRHLMQNRMKIRRSIDENRMDRKNNFKPKNERNHFKTTSNNVHARGAMIYPIQ